MNERTNQPTNQQTRPITIAAAATTTAVVGLVVVVVVVVGPKFVTTFNLFRFLYISTMKTRWAGQSPT